jgi:hypothetical protein
MVIANLKDTEVEIYEAQFKTFLIDIARQANKTRNLPPLSRAQKNLDWTLSLREKRSAKSNDNQ